MVAFTGGYKTFSKTEPTAKARKPENQDRLVKVVSYDLANRTVRVSEKINVKGEEKELLFDVTIDPKAIERNEKSAQAKGLTNTAKFKGHMIDEKMAKDIPIGRLMVLEKSVYQRRVEKDGQEVALLVAQRIINVPTPKPDKVLQGIFTVSSRDGERVNFAQNWSPNAILSTDTKTLDDLKQHMQKAVDNYGSIAAPEKMNIFPTIGIQLRVLVPLDNPEDPRYKYEVIDTSGTLDFIPAVKEGDEVIKESHPLDPENFENYLNGYSAHIKNRIEEEGAFNHIPNIDKYFIEVCPYQNYLGSKQATSLLIKEAEFDPITQMVNTKTRLSIDDDKSIQQGKNWAVRGIMQISADEGVETENGWVTHHKNYVNRIHANNIKGHVHAWVNSHDGGKTVPHKALQRIIDRKPANEMAHQEAPMAQPAPSTNGDDPFAAPSM